MKIKIKYGENANFYQKKYVTYAHRSTKKTLRLQQNVQTKN